MNLKRVRFEFFQKGFLMTGTLGIEWKRHKIIQIHMLIEEVLKT